MAPLAALCALALGASPSFAQDDDEAIDIDAADSSEETEDDSVDESSSGEPQTGEEQEPTEAKDADEVEPEEPALLAWYGSLENDVGLAHYEAEEESATDDTLYDHRGRFVVGPMLHLRVPGGFFFEATGQLVAWIKNNDGNPLVAADDAWGKFGTMNVWDVQVGRFEAWHVFQKYPVRSHDLGPEFHSRGIGESAGAFDLFTLEDTGALVTPPVSSRSYYADMYEVSFILLREEAASVAAHYFPSRDLGFELHAKYGEQAQQNKLGARFAAIGRPFRQLQLSAAVEYRTSRNGSPTKSPDPLQPGEFNECSDCGRADQYGGGGGAVLSAGPVELAFSAAYGKETGYRAVDGGIDSELTRETMSVGGYAQLTLGDTVSVGGAAFLTQRLDKADNFQTHVQTAGYVFYPIARDLSLKLVMTYATGEDDRLENRDDIPPPHNSFLGARLRLKYFFDFLM
jgi:hypothetical protein